MATRRKNWFQSTQAALVLGASVVAGLAAFLGNVGNIREFILPAYNPAEIALRKVETGAYSSTYPVEMDGKSVHQIEIQATFIVDKKSDGTARGCKTQLLDRNGVYDAQEPPFDLPSTVLSKETSASWVLHPETEPAGMRRRIRVSCDGSISEPADLPFAS